MPVDKEDQVMLHDILAAAFDVTDDSTIAEAFASRSSRVYDA